eukprot:6295237-Amphidinium_carterae.1
MLLQALAASCGVKEDQVQSNTLYLSHPTANGSPSFVPDLVKVCSAQSHREAVVAEPDWVRCAID